MKKKILYYLILPLLVSSLAAIILHVAIEKYFISQAKEDVQSIILSNRGFHEYIQQVMHPTFFQAIKQGYIAKDFYAPQALSSTFIVRTMHDLYNQERINRGMKPLYYKLASYNPRNPINKADEWEAKKIKFFNENSTITEQEEIVTVNGTRFLYYAAPFLKNEARCMKCHGRPTDAPVGLRRMYPGAGGLYEKIGEIRAIESMRIPISTEGYAAKIIAGSAGSGLFVILALFLFNTGLRTRVREKTKYLELEIEERIQAEEQAKKNEENFRTLFNESADAIFLVRPDGSIEDVNHVACMRYQYTREAFLLLTVIQITSPAMRKYVPERMQRVQHHGALVFESEHITKDGKLIDVEVNSRFIMMAGEPRLLSTCRDITERKRLEQESIKTQKIESIGTLAGGIAHDFNNLLQAVFGYISLAKLMRNDRGKSQAALEEAEKALHMSVKLTNQLLTFSKGGTPVKKTIDLIPTIENAAKFALSGSRTDFRIAVDDDLSQADADDGQISQVIQNIVLNADQAMPEGGQVEITARNVRIPGPNLPQSIREGDYVQIAIKDSGIGISEKYISKIFDPYFTTKEKGSGLGLATSYSIIKNHNGMIDVKSDLGKGTAFIIYLPATPGAKRKELADPASVAAPRRTGRVLIMDDEPAILDIAGKLINALGHHAEFATQGKEAVEKYTEAQRSGRPFDVVILDLTIRGGMGGTETLQMLSEIDPVVNAIVSSGYSDDGTIAGYKQYGFKAFLKKPYNVDELRETLNTFLNS